MADLNNQQVSQVRMLLRSLLSASNKLSDLLRALPAEGKGNPDLVKDRKRITRAVSLLTQARLRLELSEENLYDLSAAYLISERHSEAEKTKEYGVLHSLYSKKLTLSEFGRTPWIQIERAFKTAELFCPLALQTFHAEFQQEYYVGLNLRQTITPVPSPVPSPTPEPHE